MYLFYVLIITFSMGAASAPPDPLLNFFKDKTKIEKPFELRDPFKAPPIKSDKKIKRDGFFKSGQNIYTNLEEARIDSVDQIKLVGVLIGKERRAMVTSGDKPQVITLKEGQSIGDEGAELKAILPGGIIIVEKIVNVYGQEEYLETVIPISK